MRREHRPRPSSRSTRSNPRTPPAYRARRCDCLQGAFCYQGECRQDPAFGVSCWTNPGCPPGQWCVQPDGTKRTCSEDPSYVCETACDCGACGDGVVYTDDPSLFGDGFCQRGGRIPEHFGNCPADCLNTTVELEAVVLADQIALLHDDDVLDGFETQVRDLTDVHLTDLQAAPLLGIAGGIEELIGMEALPPAFEPDGPGGGRAPSAPKGRPTSRAQFACASTRAATGRCRYRLP